jgi:hypothetical protein
MAPPENNLLKGMKFGKVTEREVVNHSRLKYIKLYLQNLRKDYDAITDQFALDHIPKELQKLLEPYSIAIINCLNKYPINKDGKVRKVGKLLSNKLRTEMMNFDSAYTTYIDQHIGTKKLIPSKKIHQLVCELNSAVSYFVNQHDMVLSSVKISHWLSAKPTPEELIDFIKKETNVIMGLSDKKNPINNRKKDFKIRKFFCDANKKYQENENTKRIIPFKTLDAEVSEHNYKYPINQLKLSNKIYGKMRAEMKSGNLFNVVKN